SHRRKSRRIFGSVGKRRHVEAIVVNRPKSIISNEEISKLPRLNARTWARAHIRDALRGEISKRDCSNCPQTVWINVFFDGTGLTNPPACQSACPSAQMLLPPYFINISAKAMNARSVSGMFARLPAMGCDENFAITSSAFGSI